VLQLLSHAEKALPIPRLLCNRYQRPVSPTRTPPDNEGKFRVKRTKRGENGRKREREREWRKQQKEKVELESKRLNLLFPTHYGKKGHVDTVKAPNFSCKSNIYNTLRSYKTCHKYDLTYVTVNLKNKRICIELLHFDLMVHFRHFNYK